MSLAEMSAPLIVSATATTTTTTNSNELLNANAPPSREGAMEMFNRVTVPQADEQDQQGAPHAHVAPSQDGAATLVPDQLHTDPMNPHHHDHHHHQPKEVAHAQHPAATHTTSEFFESILTGELFEDALLPHTHGHERTAEALPPATNSAHETLVPAATVASSTGANDVSTTEQQHWQVEPSNSNNSDGGASTVTITPQPTSSGAAYLVGVTSRGSGCHSGQRTPPVDAQRPSPVESFAACPLSKSASGKSSNDRENLARLSNSDDTTAHQGQATCCIDVEKPKTVEMFTAYANPQKPCPLQTERQGTADFQARTNTEVLPATFVPIECGAAVGGIPSPTEEERNASDEVFTMPSEVDPTRTLQLALAPFETIHEVLTTRAFIIRLCTILFQVSMFETISFFLTRVARDATDWRLATTAEAMVVPMFLMIFTSVQIAVSRLTMKKIRAGAVRGLRMSALNDTWWKRIFFFFADTKTLMRKWPLAVLNSLLLPGIPITLYIVLGCAIFGEGGVGTCGSTAAGEVLFGISWKVIGILCIIPPHYVSCCNVEHVWNQVNGLALVEEEREKEKARKAAARSGGDVGDVELHRV